MHAYKWTYHIIKLTLIQTKQIQTELYEHKQTHTHNHTRTQGYAYTRVLTQTTSHIHPNKHVLIHTNTHTNTQNSHDIRQVQMKVSSFLWGIQCNFLTKISTECMSFKVAIFYIL